MLNRQSDLHLGVVFTLIVVVLTLSGFLPPVLQAILVIPFFLFVPGNALIWAMFPAANLRRMERFLFAIGSSLGVMILSGLVLNLTPWGLQTNSWLVILSVVALVASAIAIWRRRKIPVEASTPEQFYMPGRQVSLLSLATMVVGFALILAFTPQLSHKIQGYTSLWVLPESEMQPGTLLVGIHSQELETTHYHLVITFNGQSIQEWLDISLPPGATWQRSISVPGGPGFAEAKLYRVDHPGVIYRYVSITPNKGAPSS